MRAIRGKAGSCPASQKHCHSISSRERPLQRCSTAEDTFPGKTYRIVLAQTQQGAFQLRAHSATVRPAQLAELPRSEFDPDLFSHSAYVKFFFVTLATEVPYLTFFCDKI